MVNHNDDEAFASDSKSPSPSSDHRFEVNKIQDTEPSDESFSLIEDGSVASAERSLKAEDVLWGSDGSNDHECQSGNQESKCHSHGPGLDYLGSQEPGESTQADALGFVDQFLMGEDLNFSPVTLPGTSLKSKSPPFSGAKGRQSLAKRIKTLSPTMKMSVFDWDIDQSDDVTGFNTWEDHVTDDDYEVKKGSMDLCDSWKDSTYRFMHSSSAQRYKMKQTLGLSQGIMLISQMDAQLQDKASKEQPGSEEDFY